MIVTRAGTRIDNGMWEQNNDDGWYHVTLPFDFNWFGTTERIITIGTNGVLTFGTAQLPYGSSEPVRVRACATPLAARQLLPPRASNERARRNRRR
jgi:hypothetical protein